MSRASVDGRPSDDELVLQTVPLGRQWPTIDPFLFCVHHDDDYPAGNELLGPDAPLHARDIGQDFSGADGWSMYHGSVVPGFPQHPHRGFETVTLVRKGLIDHSDSLGAAARFGRGDVQWLTAGRGVVHSEMFPLLDRSAGNPLELFQIWLNLPAADKMAEPYFTMLWDGDIPRVRSADGATTITVVAGALEGAAPPAPPPDSWASRPEADLAIWVVSMEPGAEHVLPAATGDGTVRVLYVLEGDAVEGNAVEGNAVERDGIRVGGTEVAASTAAVVRAEHPTPLAAGPGAASEVLVLQARPIGEPVEQYGPFVMNDRAGIDQAFADYRRTGFGGWPWPTDDPDHGPTRGRFARHADGRVEEVGEPAR
jgi:redox-sensitive bicupin YhaK (pirin superfamily)